MASTSTKKTSTSHRKQEFNLKRSPYHSSSVTKDVGNSTFDLDSEPNMSLIVEGATDETRSGISMVEMNSSLLDTSSKMSSPVRTPCRTGDYPSHPSDSFQSPVLGESASTCRPRGRPLVSDSEDSDQSDSDDEVKGQPQAAAPSLLYKDKNQFYANILGNVQQLLSDKRKPPVQSSSSSSSSSSDDSSDDSEEIEGASDDNEEEQGILGMKLTLPGDLDSGLMEKSAMFRSMNNISPDFFPRINYVSIMDLTLDSPNLSMEANALAMKYLSDEELAKLSVGFKSPAGIAATPKKDVNPLLRTALLGNLGTERSMVGMSSVGFRAVDMSMASRKYMEKYGLLENSGGTDEQQSPKKKVKKKKTKKKVKMLASSGTRQGDEDGAAKTVTPKQAQMSPDLDKQAGMTDRIRATPTLNVNSQQGSPVSHTTAVDQGTFEPWLKKRPVKKLGDNTGAFQVFANDKVKRDTVKSQNGSKTVGNILDISRLQDLPKLL